MRDVELHGQKLRVGDKVALAFGSGNRDWRKFPDPDVYDIERRPQGHLGFGSGKHFCLGSQMARLVTEVAMRRFLERVPDYHLTVDKLAWNSSSEFSQPGGAAASQRAERRWHAFRHIRQLTARQSHALSPRRSSILARRVTRITAPPLMSPLKPIIGGSTRRWHQEADIGTDQNDVRTRPGGNRGNGGDPAIERGAARTPRRRAGQRRRCRRRRRSTGPNAGSTTMPHATVSATTSVRPLTAQRINPSRARIRRREAAARAGRAPR